MQVTRDQIERALAIYFKDSQHYIDIQDDPSDVEYQQFVNNFQESLNMVLNADNQIIKGVPD